MDRTITEQILLLTADRRGWLHRSDATEALVGGAVLVDLVLDSVIDLAATDADRTDVRIVRIADAAALGAAAECLPRDAPLTPGLVSRVGSRSYDDAVTRLVRRGLVVREEGRVLGLVPRTRVRLADDRVAEDARDELRHAASGRIEMDQRVATVVTLLDGAGVLDRIVGGYEAHAARDRIEQDTTAAEQVAQVLHGISIVAGAASAAATAAAAATTAPAIAGWRI
ncbi:GPP34 family phosphoprotein [Microbacterium sp. NPDC055910]|uniref:GOLPH3/VPS74 family protein n=1 Tax=Microbacterium sp. NPDC055910 TaxID=3345659 RepID=UPI0035DE9172